MTESIDSLLPPEMARRAEDLGAKKAAMPAGQTLALAVLAGAFIALGAVFSTTVAAGTAGTVPFGWARLVTGGAFSLGLVLVLVGGAELFTGNTLLVMAWASRRISTRAVLRNWALVLVGNAAGALGIAALNFAGGQYAFGQGAVGAAALAIANSKVELAFVPALALGVLCNLLVCLAVWMTMSARTTLERMAAVALPVTAFVAAGYEHSIANLYFLPYAWLVRQGAPESFWRAIGKVPADFMGLDGASIVVGNLLPVTLGNILGGAFLVGLVYWAVYLRRARAAS